MRRLQKFLLMSFAVLGMGSSVQAETTLLPVTVINKRDGGVQSAQIGSYKPTPPGTPEIFTTRVPLVRGQGGKVTFPATIVKGGLVQFEGRTQTGAIISCGITEQGDTGLKITIPQGSFRGQGNEVLCKIERL